MQSYVNIACNKNSDESFPQFGINSFQTQLNPNKKKLPYIPLILHHETYKFNTKGQPTDMQNLNSSGDFMQSLGNISAAKESQPRLWNFSSLMRQEKRF